MRWQPARTPDKVLFGLVLLFAVLDFLSRSDWGAFQFFAELSVYYVPWVLLLAHAFLYSLRYRASVQWFLLSVLILFAVIAMNIMWLLKASADV